MVRQQGQQLSSRWIVDFEKQVFRGKHVLLYGNVHDQFLWKGEYVTAADFVTSYFRAKQFDLVLRYDPVDSFRFATPEMAKQFKQLARQAVEQLTPGVSGGASPTPGSIQQTTSDAGTSPGATAAGESGEPVSASDPPPRRRPGQLRPVESRRVDPFTAFSQLRHVFSHGDTSSVAIIDLGDMLTSDAERYAEAERNALIVLKKALLEASIIQRGPLAGYRNTIVITAGELGRVPEWLYRENPFVEIVQAARPDKDERRLFIDSFLEGFCGADTVPDSKQEELKEDFAALTTGFQAWDLEALRRTSWVEQLPVGDVRKLIDYFKFGLREDPWEDLSRDKVARAEELLSGRVIGQPYAVEAVCRMLTSARVGITMSGSKRSARPKGVFFFVGPTGVGKTELAKAVTELVFGDERAFARFDMSEYKEEHAAEKLAGAPPGFVGYEEGGQLTSRMLERPHSILLFDEIEKAHPRVLDKFLQILEDGRLTDGKGQTVYFNQAAIIFTSNIGASELYDRYRKSSTDVEFQQVHDYFIEQVRDFFANKIQRAEIYNRLGDSIVPFDLLRPQFVQAIGAKFLKLLKVNAQERYGITLEFDSSVLQGVEDAMREGDNLLLGGRRIKTLSETLVEHPLNKWVFNAVADVDQLSGATLTLSLVDGKLVVERLG